MVKICRGSWGAGESMGEVKWKVPLLVEDDLHGHTQQKSWKPGKSGKEVTEVEGLPGLPLEPAQGFLLPP